MRAKRTIGMILTIGLWGCGSSSDNKPAPDANLPLSDAGVRDSVGQADQAVPGLPDAPAFGDVTVPPQVDGRLADAMVPPGVDTATPDTAAVVADGSVVGVDGAMVGTDSRAVDPDAVAVADLLLAPDSPTVPDATQVQNDSAPPSSPDGGSVVTSTTEQDNPTDPTVCSTYVLGQRDLTADQAYDITIPDCFRVSGTVTLASPLPDGAVYGNGEVAVYKLIRDSNNKVADTVVYAATVTAVDDTHFRYSVGVPADTYEVMYTFVTKSSAAPSLTSLPSTATRIGQDRITVSASIKHDVTLPAISVTTRTVTVTGIDTLPATGNAFGRYVLVYQVNAANTLLVGGMSMTASAAIPISMWVPNETFTPTLMVQDTPGTTAPYPSGFTSQFRLTDVTPTGDFSLALPATVKISGSVSDPNGSLSQMIGNGGAQSGAVNYYQCNSLDYGTYPDPIFMWPEGSASSFFAAATSHTLYVRSGINCVTYANYAVAVGPGGLPTRSGENTYAYMDDPSPRSPDAVVLTADVVRNIAVPALGTQVTVHGTVKDARGNPIPNVELSFNSDTLTNPALANKQFLGSLDVGSSGAYVAHALAGSYKMWVKLPTSSSSAAAPDAGVTTDASTPGGLPDGSFVLPDVSYGTGDCSSLATCCAKLSGSTKTGCESIVSVGGASTCGSYLSILQLAGSCL